MKSLPAALLLAAMALAPAAASEHDIWVAPADVLVDSPVWVNPGVYVSQHSAVTRHYPYVGCCLPPYENWSYMRPYLPGADVRTSTIAPLRYSHRPVIAEPPRAVDRLHYPDGKAIERFH